MQLHELKPSLKRKKIKRVGRGGKRGTTSGRGQKGQKSRAGHRIRPAERDLIMRIPKLRGIKNKPKAPKPVILNINDLIRVADQSVVNKKILLEKGIIKRSFTRVKILGNGVVKQPLIIEGLEVSGQAKEKIERAGGTITPHPSKI